MFGVGRFFQSIKKLNETPLGFYFQFSISSVSTSGISARKDAYYCPH